MTRLRGKPKMLQNSSKGQQKMRQNDRNDSLRHNSFSGGAKGLEASNVEHFGM